MQENDIHENEELEESKEKISSFFDMLNIENMSVFKRWFLYVFFSLIMFLTLIYLIVKNIILLRFAKILYAFSVLKTYDEIVKKNLKI